MQVFVRDNNVDQALRVLRKMHREGLFRDFKRRRFYEKPSEQTVREGRGGPSAHFDADSVSRCKRSLDQYVNQRSA